LDLKNDERKVIHNYMDINVFSNSASIVPYTGIDFKIIIDQGETSLIDSEILTLGNLKSIKYFTKDRNSFSI
jgi:hypothetical protein